MGQELAKLTRIDAKHRRIAQNHMTPPDEKAALVVLRREARRSGATLATGGKGGLPSTLVLSVMRRDQYRCKRCGGNQNLVVHHKAGLKNPTSEWLAKKGKSNDRNNIVTICDSCHSAVHDEDEALG